MVGSATLTTVPSSNAIPEPSTAAAISHRAPADANRSWRGSLTGRSTLQHSAPFLRRADYRAYDLVAVGRRGRRRFFGAAPRVHRQSVITRQIRHPVGGQPTAAVDDKC